MRLSLRTMACFTVALLLPLAACSDDQGGNQSDKTLARHLLSDIQEYLSLDPDHDQLRSVLVMKDGKRIVEKYYDTDADVAWDVESVTKSVTSLLVGIAIDDGLIPSVDSTLGELLPRYRTAMDARVAATTLRQLLTMSGGVTEDRAEYDARFSEPDPVAGTLRHDVDPSQHAFAYSNLGAHLVATVLHQAVGGSVLQYARRKLFDPLGIDTAGAIEPQVRSLAGFSKPADLQKYLKAPFAWPVDRTGNQLGAALLKLRPRDLAAIGQLVVDGGTWKGRRVVSKDWLKDMVRDQVRTGEFADYGYEWWVGHAKDRRVAYAFGYGGQMIAAVPSLDLVVITTTAVDYKNETVSMGFDPENLALMMTDVVIPKVSKPQG